MSTHNNTFPEPNRTSVLRAIDWTPVRDFIDAGATVGTLRQLLDPQFTSTTDLVVYLEAVKSKVPF